MLYGFLNCFWGYALKVEAVGRPPSFRRRGTMAPLVPDVARGNRGGVGSGSTELAEVLALHRGSLCQYGQSVGLADFTKRRLRLGKLEICGRKIK
jgi:hypothetical protein